MGGSRPLVQDLVFRSIGTFALAAAVVACAGESNGDDGDTGGPDTGADADTAIDTPVAPGESNAAAQVTDELGQVIDVTLRQEVRPGGGGPVYLSAYVYTSSEPETVPRTFAVFADGDPDGFTFTSGGTPAIQFVGVVQNLLPTRQSEEGFAFDTDLTIGDLQWEFAVRSSFDETIPCVVGCSESCETGIDCDGVCADLRTDPDHCGECGFVCDLNAGCEERICTCRQGADVNHDGTECADWTALSSNPVAKWACAMADGGIYCWGDADDAHLGDNAGAFENHTVPNQLPESGPWTALATGAAHGCAVKESGELWCWGAMVPALGRGPLILRTWSQLVERVGEESNWTYVAAGVGSSCGIRAGELWCWGVNTLGQLGVDADEGTDVNLPQRVGLESDWTALSLGGNHGCGIRAGGELWCWGSNRFAQLGTGGFGFDVMEMNPVRVGPAADWLAISAGGIQTCGVRAGGDLYCWGGTEDGTGVTGRPDIGAEPGLMATTDAAFGPVAAVNVGGGICAVTEDGALLCQGDNEFGALGLAALDEFPQLTRVGEDDDWVSAMTTGLSGCGLRESGKLLCWGTSRNGNLGAGELSEGSMSGPRSVVAP